MKKAIICALCLFIGMSSSQAQTVDFSQITIDSLVTDSGTRKNLSFVQLEDQLTFYISSPDSTRLLTSELMLYVNGVALPDYRAMHAREHEVVFRFFESDTLRGALKEYINSWGVHNALVRLSFGNKKGNQVLVDEQNADIEFDPNYATRSWIGRIIIVIMVICFFFLVKKDYLIKSVGFTKYSLSRSQLAWWTMIVICCYIALWSDSGVLVELTADTLILIGISAGTAAAAQTIDQNNKKKAPTPPPETDPKTKPEEAEPVVHVYEKQSFFFQVLSDKDGISIQRFQSVVFTFFIGVFFVFEVISKFEMPDLDPGILGLMGISSATYAGLKTNETKQ